MRPSLLTTLLLASCLAGCPEERAATPPAQQQPGQAPATQPAAGATQPAQQQPAASSTAAVQAAPRQAPMVDGKKLFMRVCAQCHGPEGSGAQMRPMYPNIGDLTSPELHQRLSDADIAQLVKVGRGKMPPLGGALSDAQIEAIVAYVRSLKKG